VHGKTNDMHRAILISDVISSLSRASKYTKIVGGWGFAVGNLQRYPRPSLGLRGRRREERGIKMIYAPDARNPHATTVLVSVSSWDDYVVAW